MTTVSVESALLPRFLIEDPTIMSETFGETMPSTALDGVARIKSFIEREVPHYTDLTINPIVARKTRQANCIGRSSLVSGLLCCVPRITPVLCVVYNPEYQVSHGFSGFFSSDTEPTVIDNQQIKNPDSKIVSSKLFVSTASNVIDEGFIEQTRPAIDMLKTAAAQHQPDELTTAKYQAFPDVLQPDREWCTIHMFLGGALREVIDGLSHGILSENYSRFLETIKK